MALSEKVSEAIAEAKGNLKNALHYSSRSEKSHVNKQLADILFALDNLEKTKAIIDKLENRKEGDSGMFDMFFNDM